MIALIGGGYGDEGKGLMTDYFSSAGSVVVRFNGGAQAAHTVVTPEGKRHVFHHFGSGTLTGAQTYLSKFFIVNPILYFKELEELQVKLKSIPAIHIDPDCLVSTPFDMMLNEIIEDHRQKKHGSCGCGINETIERNKSISLTMSDNNILNKIKEIRDNYFFNRLEQFNIQCPEAHKRHLKNEGIIDRFTFQFEALKRLVIAYPKKLLQGRNLVFEGAQGLMLDQEHEFFPHVTRSNTGIKNVTSLLQEMDLKGNLEICYITRCYSTRHGEGPFPGEGIPFEGVVDETNIPNKFQGPLRLGILDLDILKKAIKKDLQYAPSRYDLSLAITCLDQCRGMVPYISGGTIKRATEQNFISIVTKYLDITNVYLSYGPSRKTLLYAPHINEGTLYPQQKNIVEATSHLPVY